MGVNIDHVATIRNARGASHPDPIKAAKIAESSGADGITAHLREDRRHISDMDIKILKPNINYSSTLFTIELDDQKKQAIRYGLSALKNVGTTSTSNIVNERNVLDTDCFIGYNFFTVL